MSLRYIPLLLLSITFATLDAGMLGGNASAPERTQATESSVTLTTTSSTQENQASVTWPTNYPVPEGQALSIRLHIDPETDDSINSDVDAGLTIALASPDSDANRFTSKESNIVFEVKEGHGGVRHSIYLDGKNISFWGRPRERDYGLANISTLYEGGYDIRIDLVPRGEKTGVFFYFDHTDRPLKFYDYDAHDAFEKELRKKAVAQGLNPDMNDKAFQAFRSEGSLKRDHWRTEWTLNRPLTESNFIGVYARQGGGKPITADARFSNLQVKTIPIEEAGRWLPADEFVMANLNYEHPLMTEVKAAKEAGDMELAKELFIDHLRERTEPVGAPYNKSWARRDEDIREGEHNWRAVSEAAIEGRYAQMAWWVDLENLLDEDGNVVGLPNVSQSFR